MRKRLFNDRDLEKHKKNNRFFREERMEDTRFAIQTFCIKLLPYAFIILFILDLIKLPFIKNPELLDKSVYILGSMIVGTILTKTPHTT